VAGKSFTDNGAALSRVGGGVALVSCDVSHCPRWHGFGTHVLSKAGRLAELGTVISSIPLEHGSRFMRSLRRTVVVLGAFAAAGCGGDGNGPSENVPPTADFTVSCASLDCTFTDGSSDADGTIASYAWDFGDPSSPDNTSPEQSPAHTYTYTELTPVTVILTVTDGGGATATHTENFSVAPSAQLSCSGANCSLELLEDATATVTLTSHSCFAVGNTFIITAPVLDTLFTDGCNTAPGTSFPLHNGGAFPMGTQVTAELVSGVINLTFPPTIRVTGVYPTWTLEFDDGQGCPGSDPSCGGTEPDFNDLIITVTATASP
jgi:PKD repeat protein